MRDRFDNLCIRTTFPIVLGFSRLLLGGAANNRAGNESSKCNQNEENGKNKYIFLSFILNYLVNRNNLHREDLAYKIYKTQGYSHN